ncbi:MAG: hypothetical protein OXH11_21205, partial [Candidatus Aminicenantes bacterium]|nr:hypothetical protein [Candidatus Aminicenantes bacterium]
RCCPTARSTANLATRVGSTHVIVRSSSRLCNRGHAVRYGKTRLWYDQRQYGEDRFPDVSRVCYAESEDGLSFVLPVRWTGQPDLKKLAGEPVRLRFHLQDCKLYACQFQEKDGPN